jgi:hypothetical protein
MLEHRDEASVRRVVKVLGSLCWSEDPGGDQPLGGRSLAVFRDASRGYARAGAGDLAIGRREAVTAQQTSGEPAPAVGREPGRRALGEGPPHVWEGLRLHPWTTTRFGPWSLDSPELIPLAAP